MEGDNLTLTKTFEEWWALADDSISRAHLLRDLAKVTEDHGEHNIHKAVAKMLRQSADQVEKRGVAFMDEINKEIEPEIEREAWAMEVAQAKRDGE